MTTNTVARPITPAQRRSADDLLARSSTWARGVRHADGLPFVTFTSSHLDKLGQPIFYFTSALGCTCPGFLHRGQCCHAVAVRDDLDHQQAEAAVPPLKSYRDLYKGCARGCGEIVDGPGLYCWPCESDMAREARLAAKRATPRQFVTV